MCACAEQIFPDMHYLRRQKFPFNFYRNENQFSAWHFLFSIDLYTLINGIQVLSLEIPGQFLHFNKLNNKSF